MLKELERSGDGKLKWDIIKEVIVLFLVYIRIL